MTVDDDGLTRTHGGGLGWTARWRWRGRNKQKGGDHSRRRKRRANTKRTTEGAAGLEPGSSRGNRDTSGNRRRAGGEEVSPTGEGRQTRAQRDPKGPTSGSRGRKRPYRWAARWAGRCAGGCARRRVGGRGWRRRGQARHNRAGIALLSTQERARCRRNRRGRRGVDSKRVHLSGGCTDLSSLNKLYTTHWFFLYITHRYCECL